MARVASGLRLADQRQDFAHEVEDAIDVGQPVHGADEDEIGDLGADRAGGREEVFDVDAGGNFGDAVHIEEAAHFVGVGFGHGDDVAGGAADAALVRDTCGPACSRKYARRSGVGGVLDVAAPDHGFDVVLEEDGVLEIGEVGGGGEVIHDGAVEVLAADEVLEKSAACRAD